LEKSRFNESQIVTELGTFMTERLRRDFECLGIDYNAFYPGETRLQALEILQSAPEVNEYQVFFYHSDHLGSSSFITDANGDATQHLQYLPFGEDLVHEQNTAAYLSPYTFSGKERDVETGLSYFGARYYESSLSIWLSVDPLSDKYPSLSAYNYCALNPVMLVDPDGRQISTHTDENGNVVAVYDDGNLGVYVHSQAEIEASIKSGQNLANNTEQQAGVTLDINSFNVGDKINFGSYAARDWINSFEANQSTLVGMQPIGLARKANYAVNAKNGGAFDPKSYMSGGSQISEGVYVSPRDLGNYAAGAFGRINGMGKRELLIEFGAFQLAGNNLSRYVGNRSDYLNRAANFDASNAMQKTYGEDRISNHFQRLGYEGIRTLSGFNSNYSRIWKD
jgi:RHS repeat-associated protein